MSNVAPCEIGVPHKFRKRNQLIPWRATAIVCTICGTQARSEG